MEKIFPVLSVFIKKKLFPGGKFLSVCFSHSLLFFPPCNSFNRPLRAFSRASARKRNPGKGSGGRDSYSRFIAKQWPGPSGQWSHPSALRSGKKSEDNRREDRILAAEMIYTSESADSNTCNTFSVIICKTSIVLFVHSPRGTLYGKLDRLLPIADAFRAMDGIFFLPWMKNPSEKSDHTPIMDSSRALCTWKCINYALISIMHGSLILCFHDPFALFLWHGSLLRFRFPEGHRNEPAEENCISITTGCFMGTDI